MVIAAVFLLDQTGNNQMSTNWWTEKQYVVYSQSRIIFSNKKEQAIGNLYKMDEPQKHMKWKKPGTDAKDHIYDSMYMNFQKGQICRDRKQISGCLAPGWQWELTENRNFQSDGNNLKLDCSFDW